MGRQHFLFGFVCAWVLIAPCCGEEPYSIQWRSPKVGDSSQVEKRTVADYRIKRISLDGEEIPVEAIADNEEMKETLNKLNTALTDRYRETVLGAQEWKVTSRRRRYQTIESNSEKLPTDHLIGKDVVIEKRDGEFSYSLDDGPELLGQEAEWLRHEFERSKFDLPDNWGVPAKPVKIGEEWVIDATDLAQQLAEDLEPKWKIDRDGAKAAGVLKRVYRRDGILYGVMRFKIRIPYRESVPMEDEVVAAGRRELPRYGDRPEDFDPTPLTRIIWGYVPGVDRPEDSDPTPATLPSRDPIGSPPPPSRSFKPVPSTVPDPVDEAEGAGVLPKKKQPDDSRKKPIERKERPDADDFEATTSEVPSTQRGRKDPSDPAPARIKQNLLKLLDEKSDQPHEHSPAKAAQTKPNEDSREILIEVISDQPIDGSAGPSQNETRMQFTKTEVKPLAEDLLLRIQTEIRAIVHIKSTPLP